MGTGEGLDPVGPPGPQPQHPHMLGLGPATPHDPSPQHPNKSAFIELQQGARLFFELVQHHWKYYLRNQVSVGHNLSSYQIQTYLVFW